MANTVAGILVDRLVDWGVRTIFSLPGDGINGIFEALRTRSQEIQLIQVRHEEAAAFAACAYAKFSRRLGVCLATSGPGGIHLLNGLYDAKFDGQPVLAITGHTFHDLIGTHYQQDVDLDKLFMDVAAYNERVMGPDHVCNVVDEAVKTAISKRTVAHITIPKDIQDWSGDGARSKANIAKHSGDLYTDPLPLPPPALLEQAAQIINQGSKVAILAGRGCLTARNEVLELAEKLGAPIIKPLLGKAVVPDDHPYTTGGVGLLGTAPSQEALQECDTLILAGTSFPYMEFYPRPGQARAVQIDLDPARIGLRYPVEVGLVGQCWDVLRALLPLVRHKPHRDFLSRTQDKMRRWNELMAERGTRTDMPMKPQVIAHRLNDVLADDAIICCDTGTVTTWAARHIKIRGTMEFSASGTLATMACGLPYAVGAAVAHPGRQVVCFAGDGGFTMLMGELATMVKYRLPVKIIVIKNNVLGMIKWEQLALEGNPQYGVQLQPIDFAAFARACGADGYSVDDPAHVPDILRQAFRQQGPAVIEAVVDPSEPPLPGKITMEQAWHFAKALARGQKDRWEIIKTVVEDKVREVV
ncbi:thiamine pyrophosphate-dependent enzyme [Nitrospira moscoviensis]|uniref:Putative thiamine pyrophosphate-containing protein YdaP n=1 Tax=Nitrospira moscoviensis TaxID=42253 RepID=A0A0K2GFJ1_NITMO|nr:thiamine pyrophosphate-dependent enzyme [Nitrospira moscoviensis]ALA59619.1 putative thiamine pyrophosphate-containing protein YdaP [Nitrospira moscoviensis]